MRISKIILSVICLIVTISCSREHANNPIFNKYEMHSFEYKSELIKQLERVGPSKLKYTFDSYFQENNQDYIVVKMSCKSFEANGILLVNDWHNIESLQNTKGIGYKGARLKGLTFDISNNNELVYKNVKQIID